MVNLQDENSFVEQHLVEIMATRIVFAGLYAVVNAVVYARFLS